MNAYKKIDGYVSPVAQDVLAFALQDSSEWVSHYSFKAKKIPEELLRKDPLLMELYAFHPYIAGVLKLDPFTCYQWHTDTSRSVGVNLLLNPEAKSHCLFSSNRIEYSIVCNFQELKYEANSYYVLNSEVSHTVLNFDSPRYVMSLEFFDAKGVLTYDKFLTTLNTVILPSINNESNNVCTS